MARPCAGAIIGLNDMGGFDILRAFPEELVTMLRADRPAILPFGAIEWHGSHLPLGTDSIIAGGFASDLAEREGGVLFPVVHVAMTTLPHWCSIQVRSATFVAVLEDWLRGLHAWGFGSVAVVTGHYAQGQLIEIARLARRIMDELDFRVVAASPLQLLRKPELLDHAGRYETSQVSAIEPDLFRPDTLPTKVYPRSHAVLGDDPREGSAAEGHMLIEQALRSWQKHLALGREELDEWYLELESSLAPYEIAFYRDSWEQAILDWWDTK